MTKRRPVYIDYMLVMLGSFTIGFVIKGMYNPVNLVTGGASGLAIIIKELGKVPLWVTNTVASIPLFLAVYKIKEWKFIKRTLIATAFLPISLYVLPYTPFVADDLLLASLLGGIVTGMGTGLALLHKVTTGGMNMLAILLHRKFRHYSIVQTIRVLDGIIVLMGTTMFGIRFTLYVLISIYALVEITDGIIGGMKFSKQALIISDKSKEIAETIMTEMEQGVTALNAVGMYSRLSRWMLFCVVPKREIVRLKEIIQSHDTGAFVVTNDAREVFGEGFIEYQHDLEPTFGIILQSQSFSKFRIQIRQIGKIPFGQLQYSKKISVRVWQFQNKRVGGCGDETLESNTYTYFQEEFIMAGLSFRSITKAYPNGFAAVKDFSLDIADKEFVILVGPPGCGESTAPRMITDLKDISSGELYIDGKLVNDVEPRDRDVAVVSQNHALHPHMSVYDNIALGLKLRKVPEDEVDKLVQEAARILDLAHLLDRKPKTLSGGQRQHVAMGRAIVRDPRVFLMDKPLSSLDAKLRGQMRIEISKLHQRLEVTIIYVAYDQTEAMTLDTRIVVMKDNIVQQVDSFQNLYDKLCNKFTAGFIGAPQMNLVGATVDKDGSDTALTSDGHTITIPAEKGKKLEDGGYIDRVVTLGVRPEDLHNEEVFLASSPKSIIDVTIRIYRLLDAEAYLYFDVDEANFTARVNLRTTARVGGTVKLSLNLSKIHVFDRETKKVVLD